jgi:hypothetical protein
VPVYNPATVYGEWQYADYPPVYLPPPPDFYRGTVGVGIGYSVGFGVVRPLWGFNRPDWRSHQVNVDPRGWAGVSADHQPPPARTWQHQGPVVPATLPATRPAAPAFEHPAGTVAPSAVTIPGRTTAPGGTTPSATPAVTHPPEHEAPAHPPGTPPGTAPAVTHPPEHEAPVHPPGTPPSTAPAVTHPPEHEAPPHPAAPAFTAPPAPAPHPAPPPAAAPAPPHPAPPPAAAPPHPAGPPPGLAPAPKKPPPGEEPPK